MQTRNFYAGETVCAEGEIDRALYLLTVGTLEITSGGAPGIELEAPSTLNLIAFLDGGRCAATARALSDGEVVRLSYDAFETLAIREPILARKLLLDLARILAHTLRAARE
jgi:NTE family protein